MEFSGDPRILAVAIIAAAGVYGLSVLPNFLGMMWDWFRYRNAARDRARNAISVKTETGPIQTWPGIDVIITPETSVLEESDNNGS